jgi:hypothetical protein
LTLTQITTSLPQNLTASPRYLPSVLERQQSNIKHCTGKCIKIILVPVTVDINKFEIS